MAAEQLLTWTDVATEYISYLAAFSTVGAVGFHFIVLRSVRTRTSSAAAGDDLRTALDRADHRAAWVGVVGALIGVVSFAIDLSGTAASRHVSVGALVASRAVTLVPAAALVLLTVIAYALATRRLRWAWPVAAVVVFAFALRDAASGRWVAMVNPIHILAGSLWLGTLFTLAAAGLPAVLRDPLPRVERGPAAAALVNAFSPLALTAASVVVISGVVTAWRHLKYPAALWTTPYGYALIAKLCVVAIVAGLGAWNWRRVRPTLGAEDAAHTLRRSARAELAFGALVLLAAAVLVSLPSPKRPPAAAPVAAAALRPSR